MVTCGTVKVVSPVDESNVVISNCDTTPQQVVAGSGETVTTTVEITNNNNRAATVDVQIESAGESTIQNIDVGAGASVTVVAQFEYAEVGSYPVEATIEGVAQVPEGL